MHQHVTPDDHGTPHPRVAATFSNLEALMAEVRVAAGVSQIPAWDAGDGPDLASVRPLAPAGDAGRTDVDWPARVDAVIFAWMISP